MPAAVSENLGLIEEGLHEMIAVHSFQSRRGPLQSYSFREGFGRNAPLEKNEKVTCSECI